MIQLPPWFLRPSALYEKIHLAMNLNRFSTQELRYVLTIIKSISYHSFPLLSNLGCPHTIKAFTHQAFLEASPFKQASCHVLKAFPPKVAITFWRYLPPYAFLVWNCGTP